MEESEIKHEFDNSDELQCRACLSVGRDLLPVGEYFYIYTKLTTEYDNQDPACPEQLICWECSALLRKAALFQRRVRQATEMLRLGQTYIYGTLSSLTTIIIKDKHPNTIYVNEQTVAQTVLKNTETEILKLNGENYRSENDYPEENSVENDDVGLLEIKFERNATDIKEEIQTGIEKNDKAKRLKSNNRWAKKRAMQNKRPKFKIVATSKNDVKFLRVQIGPEELSRCLDKERNSEYYNSKKYKCEKCVLGFSSEHSLMKHDKSFHRKDIGVFTCDICHTRLSEKRHLSAHIQKHYHSYKCTLCEFTCYSKKQKCTHAEREHRKVFQCLKCDLRFGARREFFKHFKEWHEKFTCDYCGISFKMRYCIKDHIRKKHSPYECKQCEKRFARYNGLWLHNKTRHGAPAPGAYCVECDKRYADVYRYRWHLASSARHKPRQRLRVPCPSCDKVFSKNIYMKDHYNLVHLKQYKYRCEQCDKVKHYLAGRVPCPSCDKVFSKNIYMKDHYNLVHLKQYKYRCEQCDKVKHYLAGRVPCPSCDKVFSKNIYMKDHYNLVHLKQYKYRCEQCDKVKHYLAGRVPCPSCDKVFSKNIYMKDHYDLVHLKQYKYRCEQCDKVKHYLAGRVPCPSCDKVFSKNIYTKDHYNLMHLKPYKYRCEQCDKVKHYLAGRVPCPSCDKVFSKNIYMKDHHNLVHLKQYKYRCEQCDKNFIRNADLVKHKRRIHEGILPPKNKICYMCGRGFTTNKILTNHLRTHTGERPFACAQCSARFAQSSALMGHVRALHINNT